MTRPVRQPAEKGPCGTREHCAAQASSQAGVTRGTSAQMLMATCSKGSSGRCAILHANMRCQASHHLVRLALHGDHHDQGGQVAVVQALLDARAQALGQLPALRSLRRCTACTLLEGRLPAARGVPGDLHLTLAQP